MLAHLPDPVWWTQARYRVVVCFLVRLVEPLASVSALEDFVLDRFSPKPVEEKYGRET